MPLTADEQEELEIWSGILESATSTLFDRRGISVEQTDDSEMPPEGALYYNWKYNNKEGFLREETPALAVGHFLDTLTRQIAAKPGFDIASDRRPMEEGSVAYIFSPPELLSGREPASLLDEGSPGERNGFWVTAQYMFAPPVDEGDKEDK